MTALAASVALAGLLAVPPSPSSTSETVAPTVEPRAHVSARLRPAMAPTLRADDLPRAPSSRLRAERLDRKQLRGARTMVAVGGAMFGLFYLGGTLAGATNLDDIYEDGQVDPSERDLRRVSTLVFIPVVGPMVAAPMGPSRGDKAALAVHGVMQGLAVTALIAGGVKLARDRRARRLEISAGPMVGGGALTLRGRF